MIPLRYFLNNGIIYFSYLGKSLGQKRSTGLYRNPSNRVLNVDIRSEFIPVSRRSGLHHWDPSRKDFKLRTDLSGTAPWTDSFTSSFFPFGKTRMNEDTVEIKKSGNMMIDDLKPVEWKDKRSISTTEKRVLVRNILLYL